MKKVLLFVWVVSVGLLIQGCATGKGCGCGNDINKSYRTPKRFP
jgi:predicted small secreted protein